MESSNDCFDNRENSRPLPPLRIPRPKISPKNNSVARVVAFSTCTLAIVIFVYFCLLVAQLVFLGLWAKLHYSLETNLPRTFAWQIVIQLFGSTYDDCTDRTGSTPVELAPTDSCKYYHSPPVISILAMALHIALFLAAIFYPLEKYFFNLRSNLAFKMMLISSILAVLFTGRNIVMHFVYVGRTSNFEAMFEKLMRDDMKPLVDTPLHISKKWEITQEANSCCGVQNFTDWTFKTMFQDNINPRYHKSCCDKTKSLCHIYPSRSSVFANGCLSLELGVVYEYDQIVLGLSFLALLTSIIFVFLLRIMDTILLPQPEAGSPVESCTKILFTRHATPNLHLYPSLDSEDDKKDMAVFKCNNFTTQLGDREHGPLNSIQPGPGAGDTILTPTDLRGGVRPEQRPRSTFTLSKKSRIYICLNKWGIASRTESSSVAKTFILRKETEV